MTALPLSDAPPNPLGRKFRDPLDKPFHISAPTTRSCSKVLGGVQREMPGCSTCIRVAQRGSENDGGTSFKLLVRGSSPRRPTKVLLGGGVRDRCSANFVSAPTLTRELTTCDRRRDGARTADPVALPEVGLLEVLVYVGRDPVRRTRRQVVRTIPAMLRTLALPPATRG